MSDWKEYKLGDIANVQTGPFGSQLHNKDYVKKGTPIVTVEHLGARMFTTQNLPCVSDVDKVRLGKYTLEEGDIVFSRVGSVDRCSYVSAKEAGWLFSGRCLRVRSNITVYSLFLYYYLQQEDVKQSIRNIAVGATMPSINTKLLSEIIVSLPNLDVQNQIASILSVLDDKIECNRRINDNLEQQAQALFKSWFVDFEPFKDQPFVESELGMIPRGWKVLSFKDFIKPVSDKVPVGSLPEYSVTNTGIIPRDAKFKKKLSSESSKNKILRRDNLVFGMSREILNWGIMEDEIGGVSSAYNIYEIEKEMVTPTYLKLYMTAKMADFNSLIGTAAREGQSLDKGALMQKLVYIPPKDLEESFWEKYNSMISIINKNLDESRRLEELRDTLLPKLMSGELKVENVTF